ncbi:spore cortex biosynthesis protein YabQ [Paenibacillus turpanensis]|uniref:spore cortex biosynthesis protein YabQ n=1 Tax=Paenibacillus turpanensis TaxID=2689078 RepID=UPI001407CAF6
MNAANQFYTLLAMAGSGVVLGVMFDVYRVLAARLRAPRWLLPLCDVVYILVATLFSFRVLYHSNFGEIRYHVFLGLLIGVCFHFALLSSFAIQVINWVIDTIIRLYKLLLRLADLLILKPLKLLYRFVVLLFGFLLAVSIFLYKFMVQLLYPLWSLLRFLLRPIIRPLQKHVRMPKGLKTFGTKLKNVWPWFKDWLKR